MAKNIKWVERPIEAHPGGKKKVSLTWMREGELTNVVELMTVGRGRSRKTITKVLGQGVIVRVHMPGKNGYSEILWKGVIQTISHMYLRPSDE